MQNNIEANLTASGTKYSSWMKVSSTFSAVMVALLYGETPIRYSKKNLAPTVKHGGGGVMVSGCMSSAGVGELVFIEGIMDTVVYMNILKQNVKKASKS